MQHSIKSLGKNMLFQLNANPSRVSRKQIAMNITNNKSYLNYKKATIVLTNIFTYHIKTFIRVKHASIAEKLIVQQTYSVKSRRVLSSELVRKHEPSGDLNIQRKKKVNQQTRISSCACMTKRDNKERRNR